MSSGRWTGIEEVATTELRLRMEVVLGEDLAIGSQAVRWNRFSGLSIERPLRGDLGIPFIRRGNIRHRKTKGDSN